ncbi:glycosyltransferase family 39 protein [Mycobacterium yunnanensis]|uniref:Glycosyltransferase family 39 protein n=1 Tax=Mycobacterium yunnanensis TaxID=368477 RepID=A0A9X2YZL0_9MYCO|nr:glycosyltransferase family 39 protein [Mycobacterium yunnanensis]MCV7420929.1 glycosyltransferase family 39 protein [Mycobacterium yunnanensis]
MTTRWPRWGLALLLVGTAALYLPNLSASGYGNAFYAAAAEAGARSWSAWFWGSLDAGDFITVDKPPASLWVTGLSVRMFGMNPWAVLAPQAVMGVAAVGVLYAAVRRAVPDAGQGAAAGLIAGAVLACTPAAALMFRFNDPDALLVLLLVVAAYCLARALQAASWRWLAAVGLVMGVAFLTKMLQGFLVLPGFGLAYLVGAPTTWRNRLRHLGVGVGALVVSAGWWVLSVQLTPPSSRPYVGGSTDDSVLDLAFGYNGLSRLVGRESHTSAPTLGPRGAGTGLHRLFAAEMGNEISWLLPVASFVVAYGALLCVLGRLERTEWAALVSWGGWLVVTGLVFSFMAGTIHPYYTAAMAPAVAALVGLGGTWAWRSRTAWDGRLAMMAMVALGVGWSSITLRRNQFGPSWLTTALLVLALAAAAGVLLGRRWSMTAGLVAGAVAAVAGTVAFTIATVTTPHHGAVPTAAAPRGQTNHTVGGWTGDEGSNPTLAAMLRSTTTRWSAATNGSQSAAALELATGTSVMAIGGWSGDPTPTLAQFVDDVRAGRVTFYVEAGRGGAAPKGPVIRSQNHGPSHVREIADWVADHYRATTVGTSLVYRLCGVSP